MARSSFAGKITFLKRLPDTFIKLSQRFASEQPQSVMYVLTDSPNQGMKTEHHRLVTCCSYHLSISINKSTVLDAKYHPKIEGGTYCTHDGAESSHMQDRIEADWEKINVIQYSGSAHTHTYIACVASCYPCMHVSQDQPTHTQALFHPAKKLEWKHAMKWNKLLRTRHKKYDVSKDVSKPPGLPKNSLTVFSYFFTHTF